MAPRWFCRMNRQTDERKDRRMDYGFKRVRYKIDLIMGISCLYALIIVLHLDLTVKGQGRDGSRQYLWWVCSAGDTFRLPGILDTHIYWTLCCSRKTSNNLSINAMPQKVEQSPHIQRLVLPRLLSYHKLQQKQKNLAVFYVSSMNCRECFQGQSEDVRYVQNTSGL